MAGSLHSDTIFALSSGRGRAGIAVVRVSGPGAGDAVRRLAGPELPKPRAAALRKVTSPSGEPIDEGVILWFPAPGSFTGEDAAEFQIHGGRATIDALLDSLGKLRGLRPAEAGEFTRRAVENGKFDLTQAEALADLINAETEAQRKQALRQYDGVLTERLDGWRTRLIRAAAWVEAVIDFSDEEIPSDAQAKAKQQVAEIILEIRECLSDSRRGEILREGFHLTVIGPPNSGKSSLVNALAQRDVAIVSETAGTTRDVLEVHLDLGGYPVIVADTAGLRATADRIEAEGVRRARVRAEAADAVLLLMDAATPSANIPDFASDPTITAWNKADLAAPPENALAISVRTGAGMDALLRRIRNIVTSKLGSDQEGSLSRERHRHALRIAAAALESSLVAVAPEIAAEEIRVALREIGRITGRVDVEVVLDAVFRDFCVGK